MKISDDTCMKGLLPILEKHGYLWSSEAEQYFLEHAPEI